MILENAKDATTIFGLLIAATDFKAENITLT